MSPTAIGVGVGICFGSNAPAFAPPDLPNLKLWLRSDRGLTLNGADVAAWADQSGCGSHATQAVALNQPAYLAAGGPAGTPALEFSGTNEYLKFTQALAAGTSATLYAVITQASHATLFQSILSPGLGAGLVSSNNNAEVGMHDATAWRTCNTGNADGEQYLTWILDGVAREGRYRRNGAVLGVASVFAPGTWSWGADGRIGASYGGASWDYYGRISEIILYQAIHGAAELAKVEGYLHSRYGL